MATQPPGGFGSSSDPARDAILRLYAQYGSVDKIPVQLLTNIGRTKQQAQATLDNIRTEASAAARGSAGFKVPEQYLNLARGLAPQIINSLTQNPIVNAIGTNRPQKTKEAIRKNTGPYPSTAEYRDSWNHPGRTSTTPPRVNTQTVDPAGVAAAMKPASAPGSANLPKPVARKTTPATSATTAPNSNFNDFSMNYPDMPNFLPAPPLPPAFEFVVNDFTDRANEMAASAYSPQLAAVERAKENVGTNYDMSSKIVQGLYNDLLDRIEQSTQRINDNYSAAQAANTQATNYLTDAIGQTYSSSQQQLADLLTKIGAGDAAAAAVLPKGAAEQAHHQARALSNSQAQADALTSQGLAASDFQGAVSNAQAAQGAYQQQELLRQRDNALQNWDWQGAQLAGQQAQQALSLAQQLSNQDLNLQQLNYGVGQDMYNNQLRGIDMTNQQAQLGYQNQLSAMQAAAQEIAARNSSAMDMARLEYEMNRNAQRDALDQSKFDWQQEQDRIANEFERQRILSQSRENNQYSNDYANINEQLAYVAGGDRDRAALIQSFVESTLAELSPDDPALTDPGRLIQIMRQAAINSSLMGIDITPDEAAQAATIYAQSGLAWGGR